jgi:hypothetical protein
MLAVSSLHTDLQHNYVSGFARGIFPRWIFTHDFASLGGLMKILLDSSPIASLLQEGEKVVNGVDQRSAVDLVFQAVDRGAGRVPDQSLETSDKAEEELLSGELPQGVVELPHKRTKRREQEKTAPLLPPECQGAACHARAALASFAAACAADRNCSQILTGQVQGQEAKVTEVTPKPGS